MALFKFNLNKIATLRAALKKAKDEADYYKAANAKLVRENFDLRVELSKHKDNMTVAELHKTCQCKIGSSVDSVSDQNINVSINKWPVK